MKLISLLEKIGFGKYTSKEVDDVVVDKFEDFGVYVGQLYQKFLNKDVSSDPAIAQKIINMVDFGDSSDLSKEIKDLEFLVNQLPDKPEPKGKIGFREITDELYLEEDDRSKKDKEFDLAQQLSKLTKDDREKLEKIQQMIGKEKNINEILVKYLKENLRNWFKKEKWVRIDTQGNIAGKCGTMKKGKATQRCLPLAKARSLTKKQRAATARKKVRGSKKGKQFVSNTPKAKVKLKK
jgi:hypothetical protein